MTFIKFSPRKISLATKTNFAKVVFGKAVSCQKLIYAPALHRAEKVENKI